MTGTGKKWLRHEFFINIARLVLRCTHMVSLIALLARAAEHSPPPSRLVSLIVSEQRARSLCRATLCDGCLTWPSIRKISSYPYYCEYQRNWKFKFPAHTRTRSPSFDVNENMLNNVIVIDEYDLQAYARSPKGGMGKSAEQVSYLHAVSASE